MHIVAFAGACLLIAMTPGVSTAVILRQTLRAGPWRGMAATLGNETGVLAWALAAAFGLSALVTASQVAYDTMRIAGAVVLVAMGAQSLWQARRPATEPAGGVEVAGPGLSGGGWRGSYLAGLGTCLANPKAAVFAMAFLPQFVPAGADAPATLTVLAVVWAAVDTLWYAMVIWLIGRVRAVLGRPAVRRRLEQASGVVLIGLGVRLAAESR
ncbi:LysE family translocator [Spongiactinospora sp. 9N601]|uniref:LysE family translocator n=1 Tax=Spongiactinospora sp. 9N601 TaxID=3375149 RepID=UPI00378A2F42